MTKGPHEGGHTLLFSKYGFYNYIMNILFNFLASFGRFWPLLEDLRPFLRPDLGEKLGVCCQLQFYIN
jgi:hypothetical protein